MSWIEGTATDHRDMLDQLIEIATSDHVATAAVGLSGGTGYAVDDIITITDGTRTHSARLRVTSVSGGVIDGIRVEDGGAYTVDPDLTDTTSHTVAPAGGSGAQFDLTMESEPWTVERRAQEAVSATVADGGTGYTVNDQITLAMDGNGVLGATGETYYGVAPVFNVDSVSSGVITAVSLVTAGHLEETPDADGGTGGLQANVTGGTGSGAQLTVTYQDVASTQEDVVILSGPGEGGTDQILVGIRTFQMDDVSAFDTVYNWQLFGLVNFNSALALHAQTNISYGADETDGAIETDGGSFMVLKENDADPDITFWCSVTNRRIILVCKIETASTIYYSSMYAGFINAFETTNENPYPLYIQGCSSRENSRWSDATIGRISGLSDCYAVNGRVNGPGQYRVNGNWTSFLNALCVDGGSPSRSADSDFIVWPAGFPTEQPQIDDQIADEPVDGVSFDDIIPTTGAPGTPDVLLRPTPNTGDDVRILVPLTVCMTDNPTNPVDTLYAPLGEMDNCFWISASDPTTARTSEDVVKIGDDRYIIFQNGNQTELFNYFAVKAE